jgi:hypothetical protein
VPLEPHFLATRSPFSVAQPQTVTKCLQQRQVQTISFSRLSCKIDEGSAPRQVQGRCRRHRRVDIGEGSPITISFRGRQATISRSPQVPGRIGRFLHYFHSPPRSFIGSILTNQDIDLQIPPARTPPKKLPIQTSPCAPLTSINHRSCRAFSLGCRKCPSPSFLPLAPSNTLSVDPRASVPRSHFRSTPAPSSAPYCTFQSFEHCQPPTAIDIGGNPRSDNRPENQIIQPSSPSPPMRQHLWME